MRIVRALQAGFFGVGLLLATSIASAQLPGGGGTGEGMGKSPLVQLQKGIGLLRKGKAAEAKTHFTAMIERDPDGMLPRYYLALAHADLGEGPQCIVALGAAAERGWKEPEKFPADAGLAALREQDESFRAALETFGQAWRDRREKGTLQIGRAHV